jgi:acyl-CoA synthetase (AMP-forming)/AMP-acid ligase II
MTGRPSLSLPPDPLPLPPGPLPSAGWMLRELYRRRVLADPGREALRFSDRVMSHGELLQRLDDGGQRLEQAAARIGCDHPDLVWASYGDDSLEHLLFMLCGFLGERPLLLLPLHASADELANLARRGGVQVLVSDRPPPAALAMVRRTTLGGDWALWTPAESSPPPCPDAADEARPEPMDDSEAEGVRQARARLNRIVGLSMSSGTTTGVPTVHRSTAFDALAMLQHPEWPLSRRMLFSFRMQFAASRSWALRLLMEGNTLCCGRVEQRSALPELAGALDADSFAVNPAYLELMVQERLDTRFPSSVIFLTGTDRVSAVVRRRFRECFGERLVISLANSRLGPLTRLPADQLLANDGESIGWPLPNVRISFDPATDARWLADGLGEAVVQKTWRVNLLHPEHGPITLERTETESRPGDLLRRWPDGQFSFGGRANDVFLFRSLLVSPLEIENLLAADRAVEEVVAFGAPSSVYGAVPMVALRLRSDPDPDASPERELERLRRHCQLAMGAKAPKALILMEAIPRGPSGKPLRRELARQYALT